MSLKSRLGKLEQQKRDPPKEYRPFFIQGEGELQEFEGKKVTRDELIQLIHEKAKRENFIPIMVYWVKPEQVIPLNWLSTDN